jgi:predicted phage terminase large subunit-like protein
MDDLYKDYMEANSPIIRDSVWDWYTTVVDSRLHNNSQQLIVFTRWHEEDLIGRLEALGKVKTITDINDINTIKLKHDEWFKVNFEAIKEGEKTPIDNREIGEPLWPSVHSKESLLSTMEMDVEKFNCLYQGNPESQEGLLYTKFKTYEQLPELKQIKNYTDTADTGQDNLCSIVYGIALAPTDKHLYILDVLYTDKPMEDTEPMTIDILKRNKVKIANIESNNGGRGFARVVDKGATGTHVQWFHQGSNKEARIFSNSATVNNRIVFPKDWFLRWPKFYSDVTKYKKLFKANKFDDAPDTLTGNSGKRRNTRGFHFLNKYLVFYLFL